MKTSETIKEIAVSLCKLQGSLGAVCKDTKAYNYKYATLSSVWNSFRENLLECGLSVVQDACNTESGVSVMTRVIHESGEWMEFGPLVVPMAKRDAHSTGSAISYGRRYALCAALGVVTDDDDGAEAQKPAPLKRSKPQVTQSQDISKISDEQYQELENCIGDNLHLRQNILVFMKKRWGIETLQDMPAQIYDHSLNRAKQEREIDIIGQEAS